MSDVAALNLQTIGRLSEALTDDFEKQLKAAVADCAARPGCIKPRTVKIELRICPHPMDEDDVIIEPVITSKTPSTKLDAVRARRTRNNQLQFDF